MEVTQKLIDEIQIKLEKIWNPSIIKFDSHLTVKDMEREQGSRPGSTIDAKTETIGGAKIVILGVPYESRRWNFV